MEDIWIKIFTKQIYSTHTDKNEGMFKAKISRKGDNLYIIYTEENKEEEETKTTNQIKVAGSGEVTVRRMGSSQSTLQFAIGKPYNSIYRTPHGNMELTFIPSIVDYKATSTEHRLLLNYDVYMGDNKLSTNLYKIEIMKGDKNENS